MNAHPRQHQINFKVTEAEFQQLKQDAATAKMSVSQLIRSTTLENNAAKPAILRSVLVQKLCELHAQITAMNCMDQKDKSTLERSIDAIWRILES